MTRKDYEALATAIAKATAIVNDEGWDDRTFPNLIADVLEADNPRFDRGRFLMAARA